MAAGAADRHGLEAAHRHVDAVVDDVRRVVEEAAAERQIAERRQRPLVVAERQPVGSQLLHDELVVGQVLVERPDHIIAVGVGIRISALFREDVTLGVGIAGDVEPVTAPAFAVARRGQQTVHQLLVGVGVEVADERLDFFRRRRQADQVERNPADQGAAVGRLRWRQALLLHLGEDKGVDGILHPRRVLHGRRLRPSHWLERPVMLAGVVHGHFGSGDGHAVRPRGAHLHPGRQYLYGRRRQRRTRRRRHLVFAVLANGVNEIAIVRIAGDDDGAGIGALEEGRFGVEAQSAALLVGAVAGHAIVGQHGADARLEELGGVGVGGVGGAARRQQGEGEPTAGEKCGEPHDASLRGRREGGKPGG